MFAYPSGHAHVGHVRNYMIGDIVARLKRMQGFNVLHPFGWDAFGLPAENAAIKNGIHPETWTLDNIAHMKGQLQRLGISYAWERELATCLPDYYRWNQWLFTRMFERGLAYRRRSTVNWCPSRPDRAGQRAGRRRRLLALRHAGRRSSDLEQWFFRITALRRRAAATRPKACPTWPEKVLTMQRNWIGRSKAPARRSRSSTRSGATPASRSSRRASTRSTARRSCCWRPSIRWSSDFATSPDDAQAFRAQVAAVPRAGSRRRG